MRRDDDVRVAANSGCSVIGSRGEHVERGAADLARVERVLQRGFVDQPAARDVQDAHAVAHLGERLGVEPAFGLGRLRQMDRDEVGLRVELLGLFAAFSTPSSR